MARVESARSVRSCCGYQGRQRERSPVTATLAMEEQKALAVACARASMAAVAAAEAVSCVQSA